MNCHLLDLSCHVQSAAWEWWVNIGLLNKFLIVAGIVGLIVSASMGILKLVKQIGGWPGVVAAVALIVGVVLAILPRKPKGDEFTGEVTGEDAKGPFRFGTDRKKKAKKGGVASWARQPGETAEDWRQRTTTSK